MTATINEMHMDLLKELVNIGTGKAAGGLNKMTRSHVTLSAPRVRVLTGAELMDEVRGSGPVDLVSLRFSGVFNGSAALVFEPESGAKLAGLLLGGLSEIPDELRVDTLKEVGNVVLVWIISTMGTVIGEHMEFKPLVFDRNYSEYLQKNGDVQGMALSIRTQFDLKDHLITGNILVLVPSDDFASLMNSLGKLVPESR